MKKLNLLITTTILAALASGINAWWCFAGFPLEVRGISFDWQIVPMGAIHGAIIAFLTIGASLVLFNRNKILIVIFTPFIGWIAGFYSYPPLMWGIDPSGSFMWENYWMIFFNLKEGLGINELHVPYAYFGLVASIYYLIICVFKQLYNKKLLFQLLMGIVSGVLGSLWFWIAYGQWYLSLLHGTVWGAFVGYGIWTSHRKT